MIFTGDGENFVANGASGVVSQDVISNGSAVDQVDNYGLINNGLFLSAGDDVVTNRADGSGGTIHRTIDLAEAGTSS